MVSRAGENARWRARHPDVAAAQAERHRERNRAIIREAKAVPCHDCGQTFPAYVMEFDHARGTKVDNVARMVASSLARLRAELAKCDVVCANCHRVRTHQRRMLVAV